MQLIRGLGGRGLPGGGCVVTIGSYDGIHLGHRALLARLAEHAARRAEPSVLLTFEPLPREFLVPDDPPARLTSLRERWRILLSDASLGYLWLLRFGEPLRGVASLGTRPTVGGVEPLLEAHVFDFSGDLYGRELEVEFAAKLRDEACFASLAALTAQMRRDADDARRILAA